MKVLLVDEHPATRLGIRTALDAEEDVRTVHEAGSAGEALRLAEEHRPDVVVLDMDLGRRDSGAELCQNLKSLLDPPKVVMHTAHNSEEELFRCRVCGADSYVHKSEETAKLVETVRETHAGRDRWFLGPKKDSNSHLRGASNDPFSLTPKERQVFILLVRRYTNAQIAAELSISPRTARNHACRTLRKLGVNRRTDLPWEQEYW